MILRPVESIDMPELELYRSLRESTQHWKEGYFVAEGERVVRGLLASELVVVSLLLSREWYERFEKQLRERRFERTIVYTAPDTLLETITGFNLHQKLMAMGRIPPNPPLEKLAESGSVHVALEGIADAENMGMILRNCAAFGAGSLITGTDSSPPYLRRSVRVSTGALFSLRIYQSGDLLATLQTLRDDYGWNLVGTVPSGGTPDDRKLESEEAAGPICLLFGSEGSGLTREALELCDSLFSIEMADAVDSLNVANAVAVTLYEVMRVRV